MGNHSAADQLLAATKLAQRLGPALGVPFPEGLKKLVFTLERDNRHAWGSYIANQICQDMGEFFSDSPEGNVAAVTLFGEGGELAIVSDCGDDPKCVPDAANTVIKTYVRSEGLDVPVPGSTYLEITVRTKVAPE